MTQNNLRFYRQFFRKKGVAAPESHCLAIRSILLDQLIREFEQNGWTQQEAAKKLGVKQPRISEIYKRSFDKFSAELLLKYLFMLGKEVSFTITAREN